MHVYATGSLVANGSVATAAGLPAARCRNPAARLRQVRPARLVRAPRLADIAGMRPHHLVAMFLFVPACSLHSTATHWNGRVGHDGVPVFVISSTNIGCNLAIAIPFAGTTTMDTMVDNLTAEIAAKGGDHVRVIETYTSTYWLSLPPITWILTPVVTTLSVEYRPSAKELTEVEAERRQQEELWRARRDLDHSHVIPEGKR